MTVPDALTTLVAPQVPGPDQIRDAAYLGWFLELLQAYFLVADDMMDSSHTRRGQPCWFRRPEVGTIAINDSFMIDISIYILLKKHFRKHPDYLEMMELFQDVTFKTEVGQMVDLLTAPTDKVDLSSFSMDRFNFIVEYKTAYYSFYLPVALALHYTGKATPKNLEQCQKVLVPLGTYFQAQDDFLDAFGSAEVIGKVGTDIQDNKCSWLVNEALSRCSPEQRKMLDENYGQDGKEDNVKDLYKELKLDQVWHDYEEAAVKEIRGIIAAIDESEGLKKEIFEGFLMKIYKRSK